MTDKFKIGDLVRVVRDYSTWLDQGSLHDQIFTVVEENDSNHVFCPDTNTCDLVDVNDWPSDFELVMRAPVFSLDYTPATPLVDEREVIMSLERDTPLPLGSYQIDESVDNGPSPELGVYRPNLEDRKVGKVRVELVDKGFPNALWEVARLMTKAQDVKGYADHDWKNLPNWQESFSAAASRHRMKHNKGEFFDDEFDDFEILHKVNEAFNVLAELELLIVNQTHG